MLCHVDMNITKQQYSQPIFTQASGFHIEFSFFGRGGNITGVWGAASQTLMGKCIFMEVHVFFYDSQHTKSV